MSQHEARRPYGHPPRGVDPMEPASMDRPHATRFHGSLPCTTRDRPDPMHEHCTPEGLNTREGDGADPRS